ncbi:MAG TPA: hypothetical protein VNF47_01780 [Streptosporangiaceae bacterium]|nr:hypothetical protein [Streptosporangiaceae bacterium]
MSTRTIVHAKWRMLRRHLVDISSIEDVFANPVLNEQILAVDEDAIDYAAYCRSVDLSLFAEICNRVAEPTILERLPRSSVPFLSAKTASQLLYCMRLMSILDVMPIRSVIEIGGGLGNMARLMLQLGIASEIHVVDLPEMLLVQRIFWNEADVDISRIFQHDALGAGLSDDLPGGAGLLFSSFAVTEMTPYGRSWVLLDIAPRCRHIYIAGQSRYYGGDDVKSQICAHLNCRPDLNVNDLPYDSNIWPAFEAYC